MKLIFWWFRVSWKSAVQLLQVSFFIISLVFSWVGDGQGVVGRLVPRGKKKVKIF